MDSYGSMNPYTNSPGFMDLLHSQGETHSLDSNPYDNVSPSIEVGASQVPIVSSQYAGASSQGEMTQPERRSRITWTPADDVLLISAWLNTSKDPVISNQQKRGTFWSRIAKYYAVSLKAAGRPHRAASHCKQRWGKINDIVCKFVGCYEAATKQKSSGQNEDDVLKLAYEIYFNDHKKWCASSSTKPAGTPKRRKCQDGYAQSSSSMPQDHGADECMTRPPGVKASKGKSKKNVESTVEGEGKAFLEFQVSKVQRMLELKQQDYALKEKDFALKEKHSKHVMLENLLTKKEQLSEAEVALKDKLINDMLSRNSV
ncbi:PREDICTED: glutathione S-transferase T3-like [Camelina sativa]|uniref:Glutathione S-transferase T3-like n=1 Tax=Camelina sativa TaxID=90675 RepID=A0ABM0YX22_CAMSA|nr:PREDICTED: glutathione S-transferase T3-like [Camelina sativa]